MKIYDHISKQYKQVSKLDKVVNMYVCGPTVYNHVHIGNLRPIITFDVLNRLLLTLDYNINFIHNITDIDDKIINKAIEENKNELELSSEYEAHYQSILDNLNIHKKNMLFPKVSDHITDIVDYVKKMLDSNSAYLIDGDVYFRTSKFSEYGSISNKKIDELESSEKSLKNVSKENETDFALWKKTEKGIQWETSFSNGRPGWHTECSCLIDKYFGKDCDIHGGGVDLKFPHHENENIQNIAINKIPLSRIWMHVGHLNINNEKMSKSLKNFILAKDLIKEYDANTIRWFFYQTNYTNPINFTKENIENSQSEINNILKNLNIIKSYLILNDRYNIDLKFDENYLDALKNDFNLPNIITFINDEMKKNNNLLRQSKFEELSYNFYNLSYLLTNILGIKLLNNHDKENLKKLFNWNKEKVNKNFQAADLLRKELIDSKIL